MFTLFPTIHILPFRPNYVNDHVLCLTLSWTSLYHFTNPLSQPLYKTPHDNEVCSTQLYFLTTALTAKQLTQIGHRQSLTKFTAPKSNEYSSDYYDQNIIRPIEDIFLNDDQFANPQITEKFFIKTPYNFILNTLNKKYDNVISAALRDIHAYDFNKFNHFSLTFHFLTPKQRDLHCSHDVMLRTKQTHTNTYQQLMQHHYTHNIPARQLQHRYQYFNSKYTSPFFLKFTYFIKDTNLQGVFRNYDPITQMYIFCPLTKLFNVDESRPLKVPHEILQPVQVPILEFIYKLYNLIQNTPNELSPSTEEHNIIRALELLWPLLQTKHIIRLLAKLLT